MLVCHYMRYIVFMLRTVAEMRFDIPELCVLCFGILVLGYMAAYVVYVALWLCCSCGVVCICVLCMC